MLEVLKAGINYEVNPSVQQWCLRVGGKNKRAALWVELFFKPRGSDLVFHIEIA